MWRSATLPVSFCANRMMVLGCTVRSLNQPFPAVFALIQSQKTSHAMQDARQEGIRIAAPRIYENTQHFPVKGSAVTLVDVVGRTDAVDFPRGTNPIQRKAYTGIFRYGGKVAGVFFVCHQFGTKLFTRGQFAGNACLHSKQQSFILPTGSS